MNSGRITTNCNKCIAIKDPNFNIDSYAPLYEIGANGEILRISNKQNITRVKLYILKPVIVLRGDSLQPTNSQSYGLAAPVHFIRREEVLDFFGINNRKLRWAVLNNKPLLHSDSNISYLIIRIF